MSAESSPSGRQTTFIDTNVLIYLLSSDEDKADQAKAIVAAGGYISVQVLNEFVSVARKKIKLSWAEIHTVVVEIRALLSVIDLTVPIHVAGCRMAERYKISVYDGFIVAAALDAGCTILETEDLQHGQIFERTLIVNNPFDA